MADALTSVLAIVALLLGRAYGWFWADPIMGVVGALVISRWSWGLIQDTGGILLDRVPEEGHLENKIRETLESEKDKVTDLHIWQIGPGHYSVIVSIASTAPKNLFDYKAALKQFSHVSHTTVEVYKI